MKKIAVFLGLALLLTGCNAADQQNAEIAKPKEKTPLHANQLRIVTLSDMHGLFGGSRIWLSRTGDSYIQTRRLGDNESGMVEQRYKFQLTEDDIQALEKIISQNNLSKTDCSDHDNSFDLSVVYFYADYGKRSTAACKYIRTKKKYPQFDNVSEGGKKIAFGHKASSETIFTGGEEAWTPPGFAAPDSSVFNKRKR